MRLQRHTQIALLLTAIVLAAALFRPGAAFAYEIPQAAQKYRRDLVRSAHLVWGIDAPIATFAGQIHQESGWKPNAQSKYAGGLAQFTPATAEWIGDIDPELVDPQPYNTTWALRALVRYDKFLYGRAGGATPCDAMWLSLWAYNGGEGWVRRDKMLAQQHGADPRVARQVEPFNAGRAASMFAENRHYSRAILLRFEPLYVKTAWGPGICA